MAHPLLRRLELGRIGRCRDRVKSQTAKLEREAPSDLQIVALQEAWAFRAGLTCPVLWLMHKFEGLLLRRGARGSDEPLMWCYAKNLIGALSALWPWVPGARHVI